MTSEISKDPKPISEGAKVDSALENVASEFRGRLAYYDGQILSLMLSDNRIKAEWSSQKCDYLKPEIVDLAISINKGYINTVSAIEIERTLIQKQKNLRLAVQNLANINQEKLAILSFLKALNESIR